MCSHFIVLDKTYGYTHLQGKLEDVVFYLGGNELS
jgi:hypothetical protein